MSSEWLLILGPSILVIIGGIISWFLKSKTEELQVVREKLREDQREIYKKILEPHILIFSNTSEKNILKAMEMTTSLEYKRVAFDFALIGSDGVVRAWNNLLRHSLESANRSREEQRKYLFLFGDLLLEIRKSYGHEKTTLKEIDMLKVFIKDIEDTVG